MFEFEFVAAEFRELPNSLTTCRLQISKTLRGVYYWRLPAVRRILRRTVDSIESFDAAEKNRFFQNFRQENCRKINNCPFIENMRGAGTLRLIEFAASKLAIRILIRDLHRSPSIFTCLTARLRFFVFEVHLEDSQHFAENSPHHAVRLSA